MIATDKITITDFKNNNWLTVNDDVMGGVSTSKMVVNEKRQGVFKGQVSTENNGGFAMARLFVAIAITKNSKEVVLHVKGDGKQYQFRIKGNRAQQHWYIHPFKTTTSSEIIKIPLKDFIPSYRGKKLKIANFSEDTIQEIAILIGNKKDEDFELIIDKITVN